MKISIYHFYFRKRKMPKPEPKARKRVLGLVTWIIILQGIILLGLGIFSFSFVQRGGFAEEGISTEIIGIYTNAQFFASFLTFAGIISIFVLKDFLEKEEIEFQLNRAQQKQSKETI